MRARILTLAVVTAAVMVVVVPAALANRGKPGIVVFEPRSAIVTTFLDLGDEGFSAGDVVLERAELVHPGTGEGVGRAVTRVQVAEVLESGDFEFILDCTVELEGGSLTFYGAALFGELEEGIAFALTGGTGRYAGTRGEVVVTAAEAAGEEGATIAFHFTRR